MRFSIVIPVYNNEEWLVKCFESILNQTYTNYEVIIVDDMSEDNGMKIIKDYQKRFNKKCNGCKVFKNKSKRLNGGTRNVGIVEATGDYIMCIDCDDWLADDKVLEDIANKLNGEDCMFLGCIMHTKDGDIELIPKHNSWEDALKGCLCALWTKCIKREILQGCLMKEGTLFEDLGHHYRIMTKIKTFSSLGRASHIWNRFNTNSISIGREDWCWYRFNFCGEIYELIQETKDEKLRQFFIDALKLYFNACKNEVDKL